MLSCLVALIIFIRAGQIEQLIGDQQTGALSKLHKVALVSGILQAPAISLMAWTDGLYGQMIHFPGPPLVCLSYSVSCTCRAWLTLRVLYSAFSHLGNDFVLSESQRDPFYLDCCSNGLVCCFLPTPSNWSIFVDFFLGVLMGMDRRDFSLRLFLPFLR